MITGLLMDFELMAACFGGLVVFLIILYGIERVYGEVETLRQLDGKDDKAKDASAKWLDEYNRKNAKSKNR